MHKTAKICAVTGLVLIAAAAAVYGIFFGIKPEEQKIPANTIPAVSADDIIAQTNTPYTEILLSDSGITINGNGAAVSENTVTISQSGNYSISGTLSDGQIYVNTDGKGTVMISLNGVDITNPSDAAIYIENADTIIDLAEGTTNRLQSGTAADISAMGNDTNSSVSGGVIYAKDDLYITDANFSTTDPASLQIFGYINNGIQSSNKLSIYSGKIEVTAINNGIKGKDSVTIYDGEISVRSGGDGIKSDDTTGEGYGAVKICGGSISIVSDSDGIQAETELEIASGEFSDTSISITSGGGSEKTVFAPENNGFGGFGGFGGRGWQDRAENSDMDDSSNVSTKGIKCGGSIRISGGSVSVDSYDDAVHSNENVYITGGNLNLASGDDGIHANKELTVEGGTILITRSYEGLEGNQIHLNGGSIDITAADDGINAYGGQNNFGFGGFGGFGGSSKTTDETPLLYFSGADVVVNAGGDGIDSNGSIFVEAGTIIVNGPTNSGNGAIDSGSENGGKCIITGGTILAIGASGMDESFSAESAQCSFRERISIPEGSEIVISDTSGNVLFRHTAVKNASSLVFSSPDLKLGEKYILSVDGQETEIEQISVSVSSGEEFGGGFGGGFGFGGGRGGKDFGRDNGGNFAEPPDGNFGRKPVEGFEIDPGENFDDNFDGFPGRQRRQQTDENMI